jgi:hypothetical protein
MLAAKAHKARCIKILATARKAIEEESEKLVGTFTKISMGLSPSPQQNSEPFTPSPTLQAPGGHYKLTQHQLLLFSSSVIIYACNFFLCMFYYAVTIRPDNRPHRAQSVDAPSFSLGPEFESAVVSARPGMASTISPVSPSPPRKTRRRCSPKTKLSDTRIRSGEYLFHKRTDADINLNADVPELEFTQSPVSRKIVREGKVICPPRNTSRQVSRSFIEEACKFHRWAMATTDDTNRS